LPVAKQNKMRKDIENHFKFYVNPNKDKYENEDEKAENQEGEGENEEMVEALNEIDLEDGILNVNLGVPLLLI